MATDTIKQAQQAVEQFSRVVEQAHYVSTINARSIVFTVLSITNWLSILALLWLMVLIPGKTIIVAGICMVLQFILFLIVITANTTVKL